MLINDTKFLPKTRSGKIKVEQNGEQNCEQL